MPAAVAPVAAEYVPAPQSVHAALPVAVLYFPAAHAVHGPPVGPVEPAAQSGKTQFAKLLLPACEEVPTGQAVHVLTVVALVDVEYVLFIQLVHVASAVAPVVVK